MLWLLLVLGLLVLGRHEEARDLAAFIPVAGQLDDAILVAVAIAYIVRKAGRDVVAELWPGSEKGLAVVQRLTQA